MIYDPSERAIPDLLGDWAAIMRELAARGVIRTNNKPLGDIAELIVAAHYGGQRGSFSQAGWDVLTPDGEKVQVKSLREVPGKNRTNFSPIADSDYDFVLLVIFDEDFRVTLGLRLGSSSPQIRRASGSSGGPRSWPPTRRPNPSICPTPRDGLSLRPAEGRARRPTESDHELAARDMGSSATSVRRTK